MVVTNHAPHPNSVPAQYVGDSLSPAFASNLEKLMGKASLWVHGHVHDSFDYRVNGTRVVCNLRGYSPFVCLPAEGLEWIRLAWMAMLLSVLNSPRAIAINIEIRRALVPVRSMAATH